METMKPGQLGDLLKIARACPDVAHLPSSGLMAPAGWDFYCPELEQRALAILKSEGIEGVTINQTAPALFWYWNAAGELHLHEWTDQ